MQIVDDPADVEIDIEIDIEAPPPRRLVRDVDAPPVAPIVRDVDSRSVAPIVAAPPVEPDLAHLFERDLAMPSAEHDLFAPPVEYTGDRERAPRPFPIIKLGLAAIVVSGVSAMITLKVIGVGDLPSAQALTDTIVPMQAAPAAEPTAQPPVVEPIAAAPVEAIAAAPVAESNAAGPVPTAPVAAAEPAPAAPEPQLAAQAAAPDQAVAQTTKRKSVRDSRRRKPVAIANEPAPTPKPAAKRSARGEGTLMVSSKPPCEIAIDGVATMLTTPQRSIKLRAGKHKVTLFNDSQKIKATFEVVIAPSKPTKLLRNFMPE